MEKIDKKRVREWEIEAIKLLRENNGSSRSRDLVRDLEKRIEFTKYEQTLNKSGQKRWLTAFRFSTIGLVKAGLIIKEGRLWKLVNKDNINLDELTPESLEKICEEKYNLWREERDRQAGESGVDSYLIDETLEEPTSNLKIDPRKVSFDDLLQGVDKSTIQIPPFQREFVWSARDICFLLDSIYRGYPIGSFIFWRTLRRLPHHRQIGGIQLEDIQHNHQIDYVLDGQQRITSLYAAIRGANIQESKYNFYFNLANGRFQSERVQESEAEINETQNKIPIEKLFGESRAEYARYINSFPEKYQNLLHGLYDKFKLYAFSVIYVEEEDEPSEEDQVESIKKIVSIFSRINETGKKLTVVAKMVARCWGEGFDIREKFDELYESNNNLIDIREETILQTVSVILNQRRSKSSDILGATDIGILEREWENIIEAFKLALEFVKGKIKIKNLKYLPFDTLLVPLAYYHYKNKNLSNDESEQLQKWFWKACLSNRFGSSVESKIEEDCVNFDKIFDKEEVEFKYQIDWDSLKTRLIEQRYNLRNAFCKTVLSLYSYFDPKSIKDGRDIDTKDFFSGFYKNNLHHFFPRAYLEEVFDPQKERKDSIVNIAFAPAIVNNEMRKSPPSEYIELFREGNSNLEKILKNHLIDNLVEFGITTNNFTVFLEKRAEIIENQFRLLLGLRTKTEQQFEDEPSGPVDGIEIKLRNVISEGLSSSFGSQFWEEAIPADIRFTVNRKMESHLRLHPYDTEKYLSSESRLNFVDIMDYEKIISSNWSIFRDTFQSRGELSKHFLALKNYRNAIKHNRPMNPVEKRNGEAAVLWFEGILFAD